MIGTFEIRSQLQMDEVINIAIDAKLNGPLFAERNE